MTNGAGFGRLIIRLRAIFKSFIKNMEKIINFLKEVRVELSKVTWPTKKQTTVYTLVVIGISLFLAIFLGLLDFFFEFLLKKFIYLG